MSLQLVNEPQRFPVREPIRDTLSDSPGPFNVAVVEAGPVAELKDTFLLAVVGGAALMGAGLGLSPAAEVIVDGAAEAARYSHMKKVADHDLAVSA